MVVVLWGAIGTHSRSSNSSWVRLTRDEAMAVADMALMPVSLWDTGVGRLEAASKLTSINKCKFLNTAKSI
jgi:hypothetical protein